MGYVDGMTLGSKNQKGKEAVKAGEQGASEKERSKLSGDVKRAPAGVWDRVKFLVLGFVLLGAMVAAKFNDPFVTLGEAVVELLLGSFSFVVICLVVAEAVRQVHYLFCERSAEYNRFWVTGVFGKAEDAMSSKFRPWTRFRFGRYVRIFVLFGLFVVVIDLLVSSVSGPVETVQNLPSIIGRNVSQFVFFLFYPVLLISQFAALFWFLSRGGVDTVMPEEISTSYSDVWGQDHVLDLVKENVGFLEKPDEIEEKGGYIPGGILLWGPPGTGKTMIAEATAGEVGVPFVFVEPGAFINMFFGVGILKVKGLFRKLRKMSLRHGGVVVFFDEADALGSRGALSQGEGPPAPAEGFVSGCNGDWFLSRSALELIGSDGVGMSGGGEQRRGLVNRIIMGGGMGGGGMGTLQALLTEISGLTKPRGLVNKLRKMAGFRPKVPPKYRIFIMMATNLPNVLDPALLRPGRIDRIYKVGYPTKEGRLRTFEGYLEKISHNLSVQQVEDLATRTPYYSGAKIKDLVNESLILAQRADRDVVEWDDVWKAKTLKEMGPAEGFEYVDRERFAVAIHEASHAVAAHLLRANVSVDVVTIERRGDVGGFVSSIPLEDRFVQWKTELELDVKVSLASLVGERMFFGGDNSMGVGGDLRSATAVVSRMVGLWGMGERLVSAGGLPKHVLDQPPDPTNRITETLGSEIESKLQKLYDETEELLEEYRDKVLEVALKLQECSTISGDDVAEILGVEAGVLTKQDPSGFAATNPGVVSVG